MPDEINVDDPNDLTGFCGHCGEMAEHVLTIDPPVVQSTTHARRELCTPCTVQFLEWV